MTEGRKIILEYDKKMTETKDFSLTEKANEEICKMAKESTAFTLTRVLEEASKNMKNGYKLSDN